jgi:tetratricopeptide (TPR) repeat protein
MRGLASMGNAYLARGDYQQAEKYFNETLELARRFSAKRTEARALLSLGSLYSQQSEYEKSIQEIEQALPFYAHGGYLKEKSQGLLLLGRARRDLGDTEGAIQAFQQQIQIAEQTGDVAQLALAHEGMGSTELYRALSGGFATFPGEDQGGSVHRESKRDSSWTDAKRTGAGQARPVRGGKGCVTGSARDSRQAGRLAHDPYADRYCRGERSAKRRADGRR